MMVLVLLLCVVVPSEGQSSVTEAANTDAPLRLIYVFNPSVDVHLERALQVQSLVGRAPTQISVLGVIRGDVDVNTADQRGDRTIAFTTVAESSAQVERLASESVISWLALNPRLREDHFILEDATGVRLQGAGSQLDQLDGLVPSVDVTTKVEFTTWGKMKELFQ